MEDNSTLKFIEDSEEEQAEITPPSPPVLKRNTTYVFTEKRQANLQKAREVKAKNKEDLKRLRAKEEEEVQTSSTLEPETSKEEKSKVKSKEIQKKKKTKKKVIVYESGSSEDEEVVVRRKRKPKNKQISKPFNVPKAVLRTPNNSPTNSTATPISHDLLIRQLMNC